MGTKLFVGNLSFDVSEEELQAAFARDGRQVNEVKIITDRDTGRPRGFAFVTMGSEKAARDAISALDGESLAGRALRVSEAQERSDRGGDRGSDRGSGNGRSGGFRTRF